MRRPLICLLFLALSLAGCMKPAGDTAGIAQRPSTDAALEGTGIRFHLAGYSGEGLPGLKVTAADGTDFSDRVEQPAREGDMVTAKLPGERGTAALAVEQFEFQWVLPDGTSVPGSVQFRDYRFRDMAWEMTRTNRLLIYHVKPLRSRDVESWEQALEQVLSWTDQTREKPLVIWVFPDSDSLNEWAHFGAARRIAGLWRPDVERLVVYDEPGSTERLVVMLHEMVHGVTPGDPPLWFDEGIAQLLESRKERVLEGDEAARWRYREMLLKELREIARGRRVEPVEALGRNQPPLDPYTLGVSIWLFVRHHHGEAGVQRFFREGGKANGVKSTLEEMFQKPLPSIWDDWNAYLQSRDLLKDWRNP